MIEIILTVVVLCADMVVKFWTAANCQTPIVLIDGVVQLTHVKNTGGVFGLFSNATIPLTIVSFVFCALILWAYIRNRRKLTLLSRIIVSLVFSGALGNLIDRVFYGYVRDMIEVTFVNFAVFNIADSAIVIGMILLVIEVLFIKINTFSVIEDDLTVLLKKKKKDE